MKTTARLLAATALTAAVAIPAMAEKWDMPMAYSATNFHSATGAEFANCVTTGTGGEIEIVTHPSGSLFPGAQIKRAIQTGQVPIGERLLSGHQNENAIFGLVQCPTTAHHGKHNNTRGQCGSDLHEYILSGFRSLLQK